MSDPRGISLQTPLGADALFLTSFRGREGLSQLFHFQLEMMAENRQEVAFDKLMGQKVSFSIVLPDGKKRFWSGICNSLTQDGRDSTFTKYRMEVVPQFWLLTRRTQCRIFQYQTIPDILKAVLAGLDVKLEIQGTFEPRDYCVQYRETDFAFASRLMEEEGIFYYFKFTDGGHQMIVANSPQSHAAVPVAEKAIYEELEGGNRPDMRVTRWEKSQELRSGKVTLWDHCFELPHQHLDAERPTMETVTVGKVTHKLKLPANDALELFDYPGGYAQRFDGVDRGGGDQAGELAKIFQDNKRTAAIRMEEEAAQSIIIRGSGNCRQFTAGHKFTLERHYNADGAYVLTSVEHNASAAGGMRSGEGDGINYTNHFTCLPLALPFRPPQTIEQPYIPGPQTAVVVGPPGEKIYCDKYGRLKVQFHWDRKGKNDVNSSCWVRASQNWGGASWGGMFIPHVGQEVIVEFEEGDPDRPLITGRVYNAAAMPPLKLPDHKTQCIIRDHGGSEIKFQGEKGKESIRMFSPHGQTVLKIGAPNDPGEGFWLESLLDSTIKIGRNAFELIVGNSEVEIKGSEKEYIYGNSTERLMGVKDESVIGWKREYIGGFHTEVHTGNHSEFNLAVNLEYSLGYKFEREPKLIEIAGGPSIKKAAEELEKINSVIQEHTKVLVKTSDHTDSIKKLKQTIDDMHCRIGYLQHQISKSYELIAGKVSLESKEKMKVKAPMVDFSDDVDITGDLCIFGATLKFGSVFQAKK